MAVRLTKEKGIASVPVSVFYHDRTDNKVLRFCFAKGEDTLKKAADILCKL
jgi:methionine aminotransferase